MIKGEKVYVHGTAAKKLQYDVYSENSVLRRKKKQRINNKAKFRMVCSIMLAFFMFFTIMYRYAVITELSYSINSLNKKYKDIKNENTSIKASIENQLDLNNIRNIAESKLEMQKPDKEQVVFVKVPKYDYTRVSDEYKNTKNNNMFTAIFDKISKYIY